MKNLLSNEYWGRRSGYIHPIHGNIFPGTRGSLNKKENKGPSGYKLRRVGKVYSNLKLKRKHFVQLKKQRFNIASNINE